MGRSRGPKPKTYSHFQVTLDKFLGSKNLWRKAIAKDGSCLFRAVSEQVELSSSPRYFACGAGPLWGRRLQLSECLLNVSLSCPPQVLLSQTYHHHVRLQCADYISRHRDDFKEVGALSPSSLYPLTPPPLSS